MTPQENQSEVTRLRATIESEYQACQLALHGPAMVGRHAFITARQENIGKCFEELSEVVGSKEEAARILAETLNAA